MASRKLFQDFADGTVSRFVSRNNDLNGFWAIGVLAAAVHDTGRDRVVLDVLSPSERFAGDAAQWLRHRMIATRTPTSWIAKATLQVTFEAHGEDPDDASWRAWGRAVPDAEVYRVVAVATIVDDRGRAREATATTWCRRHDPAREGRRRRSVRG